MRKKISLQLIAGFTVVVTVAVLIIGMIFISLYQRAAIDTKKEDMLQRARNLAPLLSDYMDGSGVLRGMGGFFRMMDAVNDMQLWVLDAEGNVLSLPGMGMSGSLTGNAGGPGKADASDTSTLQMADTLHLDGIKALPVDAADTVHTLLTGKETEDETFSDVYGEATLTIGVPILSEAGDVLGGILMHSPVKAVTQGVMKAYWLLLFGLAAGLLIAIPLGTAFSFRFTNPLMKMNRLAHAMAGGDYTVRTSLSRPDEIGQLGDALDQLAASLGIAAEESEKLEQMRKDFIANVSHEFRTPLTVIRGSAEALRDLEKSDPAEEKKRLHAILSETDGMNRLVGDLLELSRLESGRVTLQPEPLWPGEVLDDIWRGLAVIAARFSISLTRDIQEGIPPILADYGRFRQLLLIFLDNAVKHAPAGSSIRVSARTVANRVELRINDTGPGISPEDLVHVWERFYTADKVRNSAGTGLGLSIAKQLADLMDARVALESKSGAGTTAIINVPATDMPADD